MKMVQLYSSDLVDRKILTQYGELTYLDWLRREKERIERDPARKAEVMESGVLAGLFVSVPVEGCHCYYCRIKPKRILGDGRDKRNKKGERS